MFRGPEQLVEDSSASAPMSMYKDDPKEFCLRSTWIKANGTNGSPTAYDQGGQNLPGRLLGYFSGSIHTAGWALARGSRIHGRGHGAGKRRAWRDSAATARQVARFGGEPQPK